MSTRRAAREHFLMAGTALTSSTSTRHRGQRNGLRDLETATRGSGLGQLPLRRGLILTERMQHDSGLRQPQPRRSGAARAAAAGPRRRRMIYWSTRTGPTICEGATASRKTSGLWTLASKAAALLGRGDDLAVWLAWRRRPRSAVVNPRSSDSGTKGSGKPPRTRTRSGIYTARPTRTSRRSGLDEGMLAGDDLLPANGDRRHGRNLKPPRCGEARVVGKAAGPYTSGGRTGALTRTSAARGSPSPRRFVPTAARSELWRR